MRMIDRSGIGCPMCTRIPVPNEEEMQWMRSGQPLFSLIAEAFEEQKHAPVQETADEENEERDAVDIMNSTMDDLEALFGFGDAPVKEEAPPPVEEEFEPLVKSDLTIDPLIYYSEDRFYLMTPSRDREIGFCPFCGSKLSDLPQGEQAAT